MRRVSVIGAGLAGCEAAWQLAQRGISVTLFEMKPVRFSPAHKAETFAELVCSNSLKAKRLGSAAGLLKEEMRRLGSIVLRAAEKTEVSAGGALAVDRTLFSQEVTRLIQSHPLIQVKHGEVQTLPDGPVIVATGPLTSDALSKSIASLLGEAYLRFYDAASPIVTFESIDKDKVFFASRYGKGEDDYINCPMNKEEYTRFHRELVAAQTVPLKEFDENPDVYEGCMPVETLAKRGEDSIRFGPLKPVGLKDPKTGHRPWANVQLRAENREGTLYNLVGFQTNLRFPEQKRVFSLIPGLENAEYVRYGVMHRNTFLNSPKLLNSRFQLKDVPEIYFAGQITGVEGYTESAASGILAGMNLACDLLEKPPFVLPRGTMIGELSHYISDESVKDFQPMGANMGLLPPLPERVKGKAERYLAIARRAGEVFSAYVAQYENENGSFLINTPE